jgi:hypothetical protein
MKAKLADGSRPAEGNGVIALRELLPVSVGMGVRVGGCPA